MNNDYCLISDAWEWMEPYFVSQGVASDSIDALKELFYNKMKRKIKEIMSNGLFNDAKKGDKFIRKDGSVVEYLQHVSIKDGGRAFFVFDEDKSNCYFVDDKGVSFGDDRSLDIVCRDNDEDDFITAVAIKEIGCFDKHLIEIFKKAFKLSKILNRNEAPNFASNDTNWRRYI